MVCCGVCLHRPLDERRSRVGDRDRGASTCFVHCFNILHLCLPVSRRIFEDIEGYGAARAEPNQAQAIVGVVRRTFRLPDLPSATLLRPSSENVG